MYNTTHDTAAVSPITAVTVPPCVSLTPKTNPILQCVFLVCKFCASEPLRVQAQRCTFQVTIYEMRSWLCDHAITLTTTGLDTPEVFETTISRRLTMLGWCRFLCVWEHSPRDGRGRKWKHHFAHVQSPAGQRQQGRDVQHSRDGCSERFGV
jgi:hypothetical protein